MCALHTCSRQGPVWSGRVRGSAPAAGMGIFPQMGVPVSFSGRLHAGLASERRCWVWAGGLGRQGSKLLPRAVFGQSVAFLWDECECHALTASGRLDQPASGEPPRQAGGLGPRQGCWADRGAMDVPVLVVPGSPLCVPAMVTFCLLAKRRRRSCGCLSFGSVWVWCLSPVEGGASSVAARVIGQVSALCGSVCVSLGHVLGFTTA